MIPRIRFYETMSCDPTIDEEPDVRGRCLVFSWLGIVIELSIGRVRA